MIEAITSDYKPKKKFIFKVLKINKIEKKWTEQENKVIIELGKLKKKNKWIIASNLLKTKNSIQCYYRYISINPSIKKGRWTLKEDQMLIYLVKNFGKNWKVISKILKNRTNRQIKNRYNIINIVISNKECSNIFPQNADDFILKSYSSLNHLMENEELFKEKFKEKIFENEKFKSINFFEILRRLRFLIYNN